jgi:hypothetical protein
VAVSPSNRGRGRSEKAPARRPASQASASRDPPNRAAPRTVAATADRASADRGPRTRGRISTRVEPGADETATRPSPRFDNDRIV